MKPEIGDKEHGAVSAVMLHHVRVRPSIKICKIVGFLRINKSTTRTLEYLRHVAWKDEAILHAKCEMSGLC
jgi:hypothetical protein